MDTVKVVDSTIGFIGAGNMAEALVKGLIFDGVVDPTSIVVSEPREERRTELHERHGIVVRAKNADVASNCDVLILAVKPQSLDQAIREFADALRPGVLVISIVAGVECTTLERLIGGNVRVIRAMPNTPAIVRAGATALSRGTAATDADLAVAMTIFNAVGITVVVEENYMDAVTGLSGSGPAYVFLFLEALSDAGVKMGLPRPIALKLAAQTLMGSAKLLLDTNGHPGQLKDMVTSPDGTTIAGLHTLEQGGLRGVIMNAVQAATLRARELGQVEK